MKASQPSPAETVQAYLDRIHRFDSQLRAWVRVDSMGALSLADRQTQERRLGKAHGALHGMVLGIKDIIDVAGWPTLAGSPIRAGHIAQQDARLVARLRQAGAILLGKTVTTEFACFNPPPTRNPWNIEHTPGGSSSGSAAAVAAGMCDAAIGSQTGGSITRPASYCGVAGLKPTRGLISLDGLVPVSFHLDHPGPIARRVIDLARLLEVLAEPQAVTPLASREPPAVVAGLNAGHPPTLAILDTYFVENCAAPLRKAFLAAIALLESAGARVERRPLPLGFEYVHCMHRRIMLAEAAEAHRETFPRLRSQYSVSLATLLDEGRAISTCEYIEALAHRAAFQRDLRATFTGIDALILPATTCTAPRDLTTTGDASFNSPWSFAGVPVVSLPCGLADDGMPAAVQLVGPELSEAALLASALWCEKVFGFDARPELPDNGLGDVKARPIGP